MRWAWAIRLHGTTCGAGAQLSIGANGSNAEAFIITIRGVRAEQLGVPRSAELDDIIARAAIQGASWIGWRVGDLEVLRRNGHLHIARPGAPVATVPIPDGVPIRTVVERWLEQERPTRPFVVRILFPGKPCVKLRERFKRARFRWNPPAWEARATEEARAGAAEVARDAAGPAPTLNAYEEQRLARVERMKTKAERTKQEAGSAGSSGGAAGAEAEAPTVLS